MNFKESYPDFASIEAHVRNARAERSVYVAQLLVDSVMSLGRGLRILSESMGKGLAAERDQRAIEADSFLKRSVPKY